MSSPLTGSGTASRAACTTGRFRKASHSSAVLKHTSKATPQRSACHVPSSAPLVSAASINSESCACCHWKAENSPCRTSIDHHSAITGMVRRCGATCTGRNRRATGHRLHLGLIEENRSTHVSTDIEVYAGPAGSRSQQGGGRSFFLRYLGRELGRRARQATVIALGLALGIGLVIIVSAAATGVKNAQASVLHSLYGVGTDITVTKSPTAGSGLPSGKSGRIHVQGGPGRKPTVLLNREGRSGSQPLDNLMAIPTDRPIAYSEIGKVAELAHVKAAAGGLALNDNRVTVSSNSFAPPTQFSVQGVALAHEHLGPRG